jgi:branched-chain amino acid transport system substrate-binding protein
MQKLAALVASLLALGSLAACGNSDSSSGEKGPVVVGLAAPFSGDYAFYSEGYLEGIKAWEQANGGAKIGGQKVEVRNIDDKCDVAAGLSAIQRALPDLTVLIGPSCSSVVKASAKLLVANKVPALFLGHAADINAQAKQNPTWLFRMSQGDAHNQTAFSSYLLEKWKGEGRTKIALLHDTSATYAETPTTWTAATEAQGVNLVETQSFELGTSDFTSQLLKIKKSGAQALILETFGPDAARVLKQAKDYFDIPTAGGTDIPYPETLKAAGGALDGTVFYSDYLSGTGNPALQKFEDDYKAAFGDKVPNDIQYEGWLAMTVIADALKREPGATGSSLRDAVQKTDLSFGDFKLSFGDDGDQTQVLTFIGDVEGDKAKSIDLVVTPRTKFDE